MTEKQIREIRELRWKCRTDLLFLCNEVLGYHDVCKEVHGTFLQRLYQFPKPNEKQKAALDVYDQESGQWVYLPIWIDRNRAPGRLPDAINMPGKRRGLYLDSRGFLKSTINLKAHTIQWFLNYPDLSVLIFQGKEAKAEAAFSEIKKHFWKNRTMRYIFPEYCVPEDQKEFGNAGEFWLPCRTPGFITQAPSATALSIGESTAGLHTDLIKFSDIVDEKNSRTEESCDKITYEFDMAENLLIAPIYWLDYEGTRYNPLDTAGVIVQRERQRQIIPEVYYYNNDVFFWREEAVKAAKADKKGPDVVVHSKNVYVPQPDKRMWEVYINSCYVKNTESPSYDYDDMDDPIKFDENDKPISRWPARFPTWKLEEERKDPKRQFLFWCQKMNNPLGEGDGEAAFPLNIFEKRCITKETFDQNIRVAYYEMAMDTGRTQHSKSDYTAMSVAAVDSGGASYVVEIFVDRVPDHIIVDNLFRLYTTYRCTRCVIETEPHVQGLMTWIDRRAQQQNVSLNMVNVRRGGTKKHDRLRATLAPRYIAGDIKFVCPKGPNGEPELTPALRHLKDEMRLFDSEWHDDILDTLGDLFHGKTWYGRNSARATPKQQETKRWRDFYFPQEDNALPAGHEYYRRTGGF